VSEEEFKAMHEPRKDQAPAPLGAALDLAGSRAYLSLPPNATAPLPGVIVIHEWWGLNDNIRHWSDRMAADGYAALAVDLYGGRVADNPDSAMAFMKAVDATRALDILAAADSFLAQDPHIKARRRGAIGWCFGGGWSLQTALHRRDLAACVIYYGRLVTSPEELRDIRTPILGVFGDRDKSITPQTVDQFEGALKRAGIPHEILRFDADHAFANPSGANYNGPAAAEAWEKVRAFLGKYLKQG
jgi:carboxymethylenebutenolidase